MNLAIALSRSQVGIHALEVMIEVHLSNGLPRLNLVGLPETAVKESKDRVRSAILNSQFEFPCRHITINLAPADLPKEGSRFDLAIALGILAASGQIPKESLSTYEFAGELALDGTLRPITGALPFTLACKQAQRSLILPEANAYEAGLVQGVKILPARSLLEVCAHLCNRQALSTYQAQPQAYAAPATDLADVQGQYHAKRALEISAAGGHNLLMVGPPGSGKTLLAQALPGILPPLNEAEALTAASIASLCGDAHIQDHFFVRPFRHPHHSASSVALVGGSSHPRPGEISRAHHGVLFLDELPEFDRKVLEMLREPMETGSINITRAARQVEFPAQFQLIAAMNPCPCGYLGDRRRECRCSATQIQRYQHKLSGPLLDRIDLHIEVPTLSAEQLSATQKQESSQVVQARVAQAQSIQLQRQGCLNAKLNHSALKTHGPLAAQDQKMLNMALEKLRLSARAYHRIIKLARTIADIEQSPNISSLHLSEALSYRKLDSLTTRSPATVI